MSNINNPNQLGGAGIAAGGGVVGPGAGAGRGGVNFGGGANVGGGGQPPGGVGPQGAVAPIPPGAMMQGVPPAGIGGAGAANQPVGVGGAARARGHAGVAYATNVLRNNRGMSDAVRAYVGNPRVAPAGRYSVADQTEMLEAVLTFVGIVSPPGGYTQEMRASVARAVLLDVIFHSSSSKAHISLEQETDEEVVLTNVYDGNTEREFTCNRYMLYNTFFLGKSVLPRRFARSNWATVMSLLNEPILKAALSEAGWSVNQVLDLFPEAIQLKISPDAKEIKAEKLASE